MPLGAGVVEPDDLDGLALALVLGGDRVERGDGGGVPDVGVGQVDDDPVGVLGVLELGVEVVAGGEEQLAGDAVDAPCAAVARPRRARGGSRSGARPGGRRASSRRARRRPTPMARLWVATVTTTVDDHHGGLRLAASGAGWRAGCECQSKVPTDDHDHHRDQRGHRDERDDVAEADDQDQQEDAGQEGRDPGAGAGDLHVDHRLADHRAAAHAAEEAGDHVGGALAPAPRGSCRSGCR